MIQAIIFDFDGLIFDTESCELKAYQGLYEKYQVPFSKVDWIKVVGTKLNYDPYQDLLTQYPQLSRNDVDAERKQKFEEITAQKSLREGVLDYLNRAKELGLRIGLASSSSKQWVEKYLRKFQIDSFFEFLSTSDDVEMVKPDPALYNRVVQFFQISPLEAIAFEDSPNGSLAAIRAGIPCVVIPNEVTADLPFDERVSLRLRSKQDMTLDEVIEYITDQQNREK